MFLSKRIIIISSLSLVQKFMQKFIFQANFLIWVQSVLTDTSGVAKLYLRKSRKVNTEKVFVQIIRLNR